MNQWRIQDFVLGRHLSEKYMQIIAKLRKKMSTELVVQGAFQYDYFYKGLQFCNGAGTGLVSMQCESVADLRGAPPARPPPPARPKNFSISYSFLEIFGKIVGWRTFLLGILDPPTPVNITLTMLNRPLNTDIVNM